MAIKASYLVALTPRVIGGGSNDLDTNGAILTKSALIPSNAPALTFGSASAVADFFGGSSDEAAFAAQYFSGVNNQQRAPKALIIGRRIDEDVPAWIRSAPVAVNLATLKAIADGSLQITVGAATVKANLHSESEQKPRGIRPFKPLGLFSDARDIENRLLKASKTFTEDTIPPFPLKCGH